MPHGVFSTILANNISNATEQADYIDRILGKFGCTNFSDTYPPAPMTLNASPGALSGSARLTWNAPGDDEVIGGGAGASSSYEIRYSVSATFTSGQFASQTAIGDTPPTPQPAGEYRDNDCKWSVWE